MINYNFKRKNEFISDLKLRDFINPGYRQAYKIHSYADFLRWIGQPTGRPGSLNGPGLTKANAPMDIMFIHPKRWEKFNAKAFKNTHEEKIRLNQFMEKFLEVGELVNNRRFIRKLLQRVDYKIPVKPIEVRRVTGFKQFLANALLIIEEVYDDESES